ncbi:N-isopropylammelide isopropylaminohydrolase [Pseudonocardiaceae bacterium YIM PH 21723]|nr:N-isopropylammelide isopropylaminohydrolase [Pseudonocardiaceae bacterium YIM PH 21723]
MTGSLLITSVRPWPHNTVAQQLDVLCVDGRIRQTGTGLGPLPPDVSQVDGAGGVLLPAFTQAGSTPYDHETLDAAVACGTALLRVAVPVDEERELGPLQEMLDLRERFAGRLELQVVAISPGGILRESRNADLLDAAMDLGADVLGGVDPAGVDRDPVGSLDKLFALAYKYQRPLDLRLTDPGELGAFQLELLCERSHALGMRGQVSVSHACALSTVDHCRRVELIDLLAEHDIALSLEVPGTHPVPPLRQLRRAGVRVGLGCTGPEPDMLGLARQLVFRAGWFAADDLELAVDLASRGGAQALGATGIGLIEGAVANLVVVPGASVSDAVLGCAPRTVVVHRGQVVSSA